MHSLKTSTPPAGVNGEAWSDAEHVPSMKYVRALRRECEAWRRRLALVERENARLKIALIIVQAGGTPSNDAGGQ